MNKKRVLFLCTGNSCRSQMAEGIVNHFLGEHWQAFSAGTAPAGYVHPLAEEVMAEIGISLATHFSKTADTFRHIPFELVITVCDHAAESCPLWLGGGQTVHIGFADPAVATGTLTEKLPLFRQVRDEIKAQIVAYLQRVG